MIEIARAFTESDAPAKIVILDEPTSSLDSTAAEQLLAFLRPGASQNGRACILITHKLNEVLNHTQRIVVMKDARVVADVPAAGLSRDRLFELMGAVERGAPAPVAAAFRGQRRIELSRRERANSELQVEAGEMVGLAGLAGHGQKEILRRIYKASRSRRRFRLRRRRRRPPMSAAIGRGKASFRSGRSPATSPSPASAGSRMAASSRAAAETRVWPRAGGRRSASAAPSTAALDPGCSAAAIARRSLVARAFATESEIILFDDPTRGVDIGTKRELYDQIRAAAATGPLLRLVHDRERRALSLRSRLCLSRAEGRRRHRAGRSHRGAAVARLLRGSLTSMRRQPGAVGASERSRRRFGLALIALALILAHRLLAAARTSPATTACGCCSTCRRCWCSPRWRRCS